MKNNIHIIILLLLTFHQEFYAQNSILLPLQNSDSIAYFALKEQGELP